jgi:hypothetical protein
VPNVDITDLDKLVTALNQLNAYKSKALQTELRGDVAAGEVLADKATLADAANADAGRLSPGTQRALTTAGLESAINTGTGLGSTRGKQTAASVFGRLADADRMAKLDRLARWTQANPAPSVGLDAGAAGNIRAGVPFNIANVLNPARSELLGATSAGFGNTQNLLQDYIQLGLQKEEARKARNAEMVGSVLKMIPMCWIAEELYGMEHEKTRTIRAFMVEHMEDDGWLGDFAHLYQQNGREWVDHIRADPVARVMAEKIWDAFYEMALSEKNQPVEV